MSSRPSLLFYCQHSLGMGHLVRSMVLAAALAERFQVVFLNGGPLPRRFPRPEGVEIVALPPLGMDADGQLVSRDRRRTVERAQQLRRELILQTYRALRPRAVVVELFPFGRKKFAGELMPVLEAARQPGPSRSLVLCSLRDILVGQRRDQQRHDERAVALANAYFDGILVHADPKFARLDETFQPATPLRVPVHYTGFVLGEQTAEHNGLAGPRKRIIVSAGGGLVGEPLFNAAVDAHPLLWETERVELELVAGPFLPETAWQALRAAARGRTGLRLRRFVPNLRAELRDSVGSVSQFGYNTALDILWAGVPALVVPFATGLEDEQMRRARRLEQLGAIRVLPADRLDGETLAAEMRALLRFQPSPVAIDLDGARNTTRLVEDLLWSQRSGSAANPDAMAAHP